MEKNDALQEVQRAVAREKIVGEYELAKLSVDFYKTAKKSGDAGAAYVRKIVYVRRRKITRLAEQGGVPPKELLPEEEELYHTIRDMCKKFTDSTFQ